MDHGADSDSLMGLPPRETNKPWVCCNAETICGQNQRNCAVEQFLQRLLTSDGPLKILLE